jgi:hypothetical protein
VKYKSFFKLFIIISDTKTNYKNNNNYFYIMETKYQILDTTNTSKHLKEISDIYKYISNKTNKNILINILKYCGTSFASKNEQNEMTITYVYNDITNFDYIVLRSNTIPAKSLIQDTVTYHDCLNINSFKINIIKMTTGIHIEIGGTNIDKHYGDWMETLKYIKLNSFI